MWKAFVFVCLCACAAQAQNRGRVGFSSSTAKPSPTSSFFGFSQTTRSPITPTPVLKASTAGHTIITVTKQIAPEPLKYPCKEKNERYPVTGFCDKYVECIDGVGEEKTCPDGLLYNPDLSYAAYPCVYPNQYQCLERSALQPAEPTDDCPHQFGFYRLGDSKNCSWFRNCVNGVGYDFSCPEGLAYNPATYQCDWADEVEECDVDAFIGFRCPEPKVSEEFGPPAGYRFFSSKDDCQKYFMCIGNKPRILRCGGQNGFDELRNTCVSADEVATCPEELRVAARQAREDELLRLQKELEFSANPPLLKKRLNATTRH